MLMQLNLARLLVEPLGSINYLWILDLILIIASQKLVSKQTSPVWRKQSLRWIPLIFLIFAIGKWYPFHYTVFFMSILNHFGTIVLVALGMGYAIQNIRVGSKGHRRCGMAYGFSYLYCILFFINHILPLATYYFFYTYIDISLETIFWLTCGLWVVIFIPLNDAAKKKYVPPVTTLCDTCSYDLLGSACQTTCPECGSAITKDIQPLSKSSTSSADV